MAVNMPSKPTSEPQPAVRHHALDDHAAAQSVELRVESDTKRDLLAALQQWATAITTPAAEETRAAAAPSALFGDVLAAVSEANVKSRMHELLSRLHGDASSSDTGLSFGDFCTDALTSLLAVVVPVAARVDAVASCMASTPAHSLATPVIELATVPVDSAQEKVADGPASTCIPVPVTVDAQRLLVPTAPITVASQRAPRRPSVLQRARSTAALRRLSSARTPPQYAASASAVVARVIAARDAALFNASLSNSGGGSAGGTGAASLTSNRDLLSLSGRMNGSATDALVDMLPLSVAVFAAHGLDPNASVSGRPQSRNDTPSVRSNPDALLSATRHTMNATFVDDCDDGTTELNQYVLLDPLGKGSQGEVFLAMDTEKNELRAVKAVPRPGGASPDSSRAAVGRPLNAARRRQREQLEREVAIMKRCRHRNVVALYEVIDDPAQERMYLVMQYVEHGPIASVGADGGVSRTVEPVLLARFARQLAAGLEYLHRRGIIHRDIKPENILLGADEQVYLADFGTAEMFESGARAGVEGTRGTLAFVAPELLEDRGHGPALHPNLAAVSMSRYPQRVSVPGAATSPASRSPRRTLGTTASSNVDDDEERVVDGEAVDVWALGVTLYALLYGKLPFFADTAPSLFQAILHVAVKYPPLLPFEQRGVQARAGRPAATAVDPVTGLPSLSATQAYAEPPFARDDRFAHSASSPGDSLHRSTTERLESSAEYPPSLQASASRRSSACVPAPGLALSMSAAPQVQPQHAAWRRVLGGMLEKDPQRRWSLERVRRALTKLLAACDEAEHDHAPITRRQRRL